MHYPVHIRFSGMEPSLALIAAAETHAHGLAWEESEILNCWVGIHCHPEEQPGGMPYSVRLDASIPGYELVTHRVPHNNVHLALGHAFEDMARQLQAVDPNINHAEYAVTVNGQLEMPQGLYTLPLTHRASLRHLK